MAVSVQSGEQPMIYSNDEYAHSLLSDQVNDVLKTANVMCTTIADIVRDNNLDKIDILKMDIEGMEYGVLYGLPDEIYQKTGAITLEIHDHKTQPTSQLLEFLNKKDFSIVPSRTNPHVYLAVKK